jgi:hypothetical protein
VSAIVVWKHPLLLDSDQTVLDLPRGATVLHFAEQHGQLCLWEAHLLGETEIERRAFRIVGTGIPADVDPSRHLGTTLVHGGTFVFHLFEEPAP